LGLFDEITFEAGIEQLPEDLTRTGWQTKDLDPDMCHLMVQPDGLFVRRRHQIGGGKPLLEINPQSKCKSRDLRFCNRKNAAIRPVHIEPMAVEKSTTTQPFYFISVIRNSTSLPRLFFICLDA